MSVDRRTPSVCAPILAVLRLAMAAPLAAATAALVLAGAAMLLATPQLAGAKPSHKPKPGLVATPAQAKQIAKLEALTATLAKEVAALEARPIAPAGPGPAPANGPASGPLPPITLPFQGPAGGALTGDYPNPRLAPGTVGTADLVPGAVSSAAVADGSLTGLDVVDGALAPPLIAAGQVQARSIQPFTGNSQLLGTVVEYPVPGSTIGARTITPGESSVVIRISCPAGTHVLAGGWEWSDEDGNGTIMYESHPTESESGEEPANTSWEWRPKVLSGGTTNTFQPKLLCLLD